MLKKLERPIGDEDEGRIPARAGGLDSNHRGRRPDRRESGPGRGVGHRRRRVVESGTGNPIPSATVLVRGAQHGPLTDAGGAFSIPDILAGERTIEA